MNLRSLKAIINPLRKFSLKNKSAGFTLIELLVVSIMGSLMVSSLMWLMNDLIRENQQDLARSSTQQDMQKALNYIAEDLRESVYVYDNDELNRILNYLPFSNSSSDTIPILAFWKVEPIPYSDGHSLPDCSNSNISSDKKDECEVLRIERRTYTLVMYLLSTANSGKWDGNARISRYALRKYDTSQTYTNSGKKYLTLVRENGYADPQTETTFNNWPLDIDGNNVQDTGTISSSIVPLVDFVASPTHSNVSPPNCPAGDSSYQYQRTPSSSTSKSFFACVGTNLANTSNQDVVLFLTGNAKGNSGLSKDKIIPTLKTQVINRGVIEKIIRE